MERKDKKRNIFNGKVSSDKTDESAEKDKHHLNSRTTDMRRESSHGDLKVSTTKSPSKFIGIMSSDSPKKNNRTVTQAKGLDSYRDRSNEWKNYNLLDFKRRESPENERIYAKKSTYRTDVCKQDDKRDNQKR